MKRILVALLFTGITLPVGVFAGGILTNSNQSASYVRMLARDASTGLDAVYYNPAGLTKLADGFHLSLSNQSIFQKKTIENKFPLLHNAKYVGDVAAPLFPSFYAVYKKEKFALGFGFQPNSGGGSAKYDTGLPSFEIPVSAIPASLTASGIPTTDYSANINFEGTSVFWGAQVNASYAINDMISVSAGARIILAKNTYKGYLKDIMINPNQPAFGAAYNGTSLVSAPLFFTDAATTLTGWAAGATSYAAGLQPIVTGGGGTLTLAQAQAALLLTATQVAQIQGLLGAAGLTPTQIGGINIQTAQATLAGAAPVFTAKSAAMTANAAGTADKDVDTEQTGTGYTPIFGANLTFGEKLNVGIKYELKTKLTLKNKTTVDGTGLFTDGLEFRNDIPAILSVGVGYKALPKLKVSAGMHYYFDKNATIEYFVKDATNTLVKKEKTIEGNLYEIALGCEYDLTDKILVSLGYLNATTGVGQAYQTDLSHSLSSNTIGFGGAYKVSEKMQINIGMLYTMYKEGFKHFDYTPYGIADTDKEETYKRTNIDFAIGIEYHF